MAREREKNLNRRELLTAAWHKAGTGNEAHRHRRWVRPPFALAEPAFLNACTGCGDCTAACPHDVIFTLPPAAGLRSEGTPALNLLNRGCHMCEDWPCVAACKTGALVPPEADEDERPDLPKLARAEINVGACIAYFGPECGACAHACPVDGALDWEMSTRPVIRADLCTGCALCREVCIVDPKAIVISVGIRSQESAEGP